MKKNRILIALVIGMFLIMGGCAAQDTAEDKTPDQSAEQQPAIELNVSAAASLKDALTEIETIYETDNPNINMTINFAGSGVLQQQIEQGANVDLFISASTANMDTLKEKGLLVDSSIKNLLGNKLVLVVPADSDISIDSFADVTDASINKIALGEPGTVPAGKYAEQVFTYLNILDQVKEKVVYAQDVRQVLNWVETGEADAGAVYLTDAKISDKVNIVATADPESHKAVVYPSAIIKDSKNIDAADDFLTFLASEQAKTIFDKYGFEVL